MKEESDLDLFAEEALDMSALVAEELPAGDAYIAMCCFATFTSASCPASTFLTVGSFTSGCS